MTSHAPGPDAPHPRHPFDQAAVFLATCLCLSLLPLWLFKRLPIVKKYATEKWSGCGLMGSACGVATYLALPANIAMSWLALVAGTLLSVVISDRAEKALGVHDDTRIVIDEWIGAWIACTAVAHQWGWPIVFAFVFFRVFDVIKWPFGFLQKLPGGWGVTLDDVGAGVVAWAALHLHPLLRGL